MCLAFDPFLFFISLICRAEEVDERTPQLDPYTLCQGKRKSCIVEESWLILDRVIKDYRTRRVHIIFYFQIGCS